MQEYQSDSIENITTIYSILYEKHPKNKIDISYNYNTRLYTLKLTNEIIEDTGYLDVPLDFDIQVIYGDSVSHDTPILIMDSHTGLCIIKKVSEITHDFVDTIFDKQEAVPQNNLKVWSKTGWNPIEKIIRHKTDKNMYKVTFPNGIVIVSEDHSLLTIDDVEIKPIDLNKDTKLLYSFPDISPNQSELSDVFMYLLGFIYHCKLHTYKDNENIVIYGQLSYEIQQNLLLYFKDNIKLTALESDTFCIYIKNSQKCIKKFSLIFADGLSMILNETIDKIKQFLDGYHSYSYSYAIPSLKEQAEIYFLQKRLGCNVSLGDYSVVLLGKTTEYIYDIQTRDGTFGAGIGEMIVKNTDSIFLKIKYNTNDYSICRKSTFELASKCGDILTKEVFNRKPIEMEFEKVFQPFILLTKKRYIGKKYEDPQDPLKLKGLTTTGIALTRRDYSEYTKECYSAVIDTLVNKSNIKEGIKVFKEYVDRLEKYEANIDQLVLSSLLAKEYKTQPVHVVLAKKLKERQMEVQVGDRIPYIFIESFDKSKKKSELGEDPTFAKTHNIRYNRVCYLENLSKPIIGFFKVVLESSPDLLKDIIDYTNTTIIRCGGKKVSF